MAEHRHQRPTEPMKGILPESRPSRSRVLALVTLLPVGGLLLLLLSGLTLTGTLIGLAVTTPLFLVLSPVLVPAALTLALAVAGFLTSGAFGITAFSSFSWIVNYLRRARLVERMRGHEMGQKAREVGKRAVRSPV